MKPAMFLAPALAFGLAFSATTSIADDAGVTSVDTSAETHLTGEIVDNKKWTRFNRSRFDGKSGVTKTRSKRFLLNDHSDRRANEAANSQGDPNLIERLLDF